MIWSSKNTLKYCYKFVFLFQSFLVLTVCTWTYCFKMYTVQTTKYRAYVSVFLIVHIYVWLNDNCTLHSKLYTVQFLHFSLWIMYISNQLRVHCTILIKCMYCILVTQLCLKTKFSLHKLKTFPWYYEFPGQNLEQISFDRTYKQTKWDYYSKYI